MRPLSSIACEPQPTWHAAHGPHSALRLSPHQRNVEGTASAAPNGHRYLQNGRSKKADATIRTVQNVTKGQERFHTPTRKEVLHGSTSASLSAHPMEKKDTASRMVNMPYLIHFFR